MPSLFQVLSRENGYFVRLFNVHLEPGVRGQPTRDRLPDDFVVLPKDETTKVTDNTPIFLSRTMTTKSLNVAATGYAVIPCL